MSDTNGEFKALRELEQRLSDKVLTLNEMAENVLGWEATRLGGKAQGVDLALSFVQQAIREMEQSGRTEA